MHLKAKVVHNIYYKIFCLKILISKYSKSGIRYWQVFKNGKLKKKHVKLKL